jgi:DNA polymerase elongation subunit (family B)
MTECFYLQPFKWEENVERVTDSKAQVIHCWAKAIPASPDGTPLARETTTTYLFRVKSYPYRVTLILPDDIKESEVKSIRSHFQTWVTTYQGMVSLDREEYYRRKGDKVDLEQYFQQAYYGEYSPKSISYEKRRTVYYYERTSEEPLDNPDIRYPEKETWVMHLDFVNRDAAMKFASAGQGGYMSGEYIDGKRNKAFVKQIYGKTYKFAVGFKGIDSVQKLLTDRKVPRCGWFFVRDAKAVKPAEKIALKGTSQTWITEHGTSMTLDGTIPEYFIESVSILPADQKITRGLLSIPSVISWDIECYSDNHKAMPNPWIPAHAAYIITAVYQQYRKPETRIRKAFVFGNCDYTTPTEADGVSTALVKCETEMEMIDAFSQFVQDANADILIGYNIFGFDINYLKTRMERCLHSWQNMGRLRDNITHTGFTDWSSSAYGKNQMYWIESPGRICVDMMKIIERDYKFSDYKLETVSQALLGKGKNDVTPQDMFRIYEMSLRNEPGCEAEMLKVVLYGIQDAVLPIELFEKINGWPFFIESSNVMCVNPMDLFTRGQQLRLLNQFYDKCFYLGFVIDSRKVNIIEAEGAYVVPPKKGLHHNMMTLDFASLYPSIMIAHNIGHDTLVLDDSIPDEHCHVFEWTDEEEKAVNQAGNFEGDKDDSEEILPGKDEEPELDDTGKAIYKIQKNKDGKWRFRFIKVEYGHRSIASTMLVDLLGARKAVRSEQKKVKDSDPMYWEILEQRQKAIKVSCNSVYGMLLAQATGKLPLAEGGICVTFRGRQLNLEMQRLAKEKFGAETVYGDSVTGETPVLIRGLRFGPRYVQIKNLGQDWSGSYHGDKEISNKFLAGLQVWSDKGWTEVRSIIRHKCHKRIMRVITNTGLVDVTEDHSLLNPSGEKVSPKDIKPGDSLLHVDLPVTRSFFSHGFGTARFVRQVDAARFYFENDLSHLKCNVGFRSEQYVLEWEKESVNPDEIKEIIDLGIRDEYVYDLTTGNHHFSAGIGRMVVHNTDSIMVKTAYTKLMVEAAHQFDHKPTEEEIHQLAVQMGIADYSSETAARFLEHYHGFKEEYEVCNEMGDHMASEISGHLPKPISLEFENVFVDALFLMKKRYACVVLDRDKMVVKRHPHKMYTKGIMLARRDNCSWARELFREALFSILCGKDRKDVALLVQEHIHRLLTWQVPMKDLEIIQKLGFDYKSETFPLKLFSEHLQDIGKPAKPNDRIAFIVSTTPNRLVENPKDVKLGHHYRLSETLREEISAGTNSIDYLYYIERLMNDVNQIFSIGFMEEIAVENIRRMDRERGLFRLKIDAIETEMKSIQEKQTQLERLIEKASSQKCDKLVGWKKELRLHHRRYLDLEKNVVNLNKNQTILETKGMETFNKKMKRSDLLLDDLFFEHIVQYLSLRRQLLKEIVDYTPKPKPQAAPTKGKIQQTLSGWLK